MLDKLLVVICSIGILIGVSGLAYGLYQRGEIKDNEIVIKNLEASLAAATLVLKADTKAAEVKVVEVEKITKRKEAQVVALKEAVKAEPDWADAEVPARVLNAIGM